MKFAVAVVILAAAVSANPSGLGVPLGLGLGLNGLAVAPHRLGLVSPLLAPGLGLGHGIGLGLGHGLGLAPGLGLGLAPLINTKIISNLGPWGVPGTTIVAGAQGPALIAGSAPHAALLAAPAVPLGGKYVAANRGSVHVAPLDGHIQSVNALNVQPAPGTL